MALGQVFLRPQQFRRRPSATDLRMADGLFEALSRLILDAMTDGGALPKVEAAVQGRLTALFGELEQNRSRAEVKMKAWFEPVLGKIMEAVAASGGLGDGANTGQSATVLLGLLGELLDGMAADQLAARLNELADIIEHDLGLNQRRLLGFFREIMDAAVESLTAEYLAGNHSQAAKNHFLIGSRLAALENELLHWLELELDRLPMSRTQLIEAFAELLKNGRWDEWLGKGREILDKATRVTGGLSTAFSGGISGGVSVGTRAVRRGPISKKAAAGLSMPGRRDVSPDKQISWYVSWFLQSNWAEKSRWWDGTKSVQDRFQLENEAVFEKMAFKNIAATDMENLAMASSGVADLVETGLHTLSAIDKNDFTGNIFNGIPALSRGLMSLLAGDSREDSWQTMHLIFQNLFVKYGLGFGGSVLGGFQGHTNGQAAFWAAGVLPDWAESLLYSMWTDHSREALLSILTLHNADPTGKPASENHLQIDGLVLLCMDALTWISTLLPWGFDGRKHYGFGETGSGKLIGLHFLGIGVGCVGLLGGLIGMLIGWLISGGVADARWIRLTPISLLKWPFYYYLVWENRCDDGRFGIDLAGHEVAFPGYQPAEESPYKLPFAKGSVKQCFQGHHGVWSHNAKTTQVYGLDFPLNFGDEILAMRGGTVTKMETNKHDDDHENGWNYVVIRHDDSSETALPNPLHDRRHEPEPLTTYAQYGHARYLGIVHAFALRGIPESRIVGSRVRQGDLILLGGNTGRSFFDHLHVHVLGEKEGERPMRGAVQSKIGDYPHLTIPFVFNEIRPFIGKNGVPKSLEFYESDNEPKPVLADSMALFHPDYHRGLVKTVGPGFIEIYEWAVNDERAWLGCHLFIEDHLDEATTIFHYKKIVDVDRSRNRLLVETDWDSPAPRPESHYRIGAKSYPQASDYQHKLTFLAARSEAGVVQNFADGHIPWQLTSLTHFAPENHGGQLMGGGQVGQNFVVLEPAARLENGFYEGRHLCIERGEEVLVYEKIIRYDGSTRRAFIEDVWLKNLLTGAGTGDRYSIGNLPYHLAPAAEKVHGFLAPDQPPGQPMPQNFADGHAPFQLAP